MCDTIHHCPSSSIISTLRRSLGRCNSHVDLILRLPCRPKTRLSVRRSAISESWWYVFVCLEMEWKWNGQFDRRNGKWWWTNKFFGHAVFQTNLYPPQKSDVVFHIQGLPPPKKTHGFSPKNLQSCESRRMLSCRRRGKRNNRPSRPWRPKMLNWTAGKPT